MDRLKLSIGRTYNLGNYESLRLDVGIEKDVEGEGFEIREDMDIELRGWLSHLEAKNEVKK